MLASEEYPYFDWQRGDRVIWQQLSVAGFTAVKTALVRNSLLAHTLWQSILSL